MVLASHNGVRFDTPMLLSECWRNNIPIDTAGRWWFIDTLDIVRAAGSGMAGGCAKLQCLLHSMRGTGDALTTHRALDDCYALRAVVQHVADLRGVTAWYLARQFVVPMDVESAAAHLSVLM